VHGWLPQVLRKFSKLSTNGVVLCKRELAISA
jgi:hypothetical protein